MNVGPTGGDSKPVLRPARVTDLPAIYRGELGYICQWEPQHEHAWRMAAEQNLVQWVENFERLIVACVEDQIVGYSLWSDEQGEAELCTLHVSQAYRRRGIGQVLVDAYVAEASQAGFNALGLHVRSDNPAPRLYERAGFAEVGPNAHGYLRYERQAVV